MIKDALHSLYSGGWVANFVVGVALFLILSGVGALINTPKSRLYGTALGITILFWVVIITIGRHLPTNDASPPPEPSMEVSPKARPTANEERVLLDVKLEYLLSFFTKYTEAQAQKLVETYIGKWVQVSGEVIDVSSYSDSSIVTIRPPASTFSVLAQFEERRWMDRVLVLRRGEAITAFGKLTKIKSFTPTYVTLQLDNCELVE